jgi:hypothetical protein
MIANIYRVCNDVCNDVYKYDFMFVVNCNSYNVFSCVENKLGVIPQLTRKTTVNFPTKFKGHVCIHGSDILPDGKLVFAEREGKRLLMFSNNGNYEKDIVRFSGKPFCVLNSHWEY